MGKKTNQEHQALELEILERIDIRGIYTGWGCEFTKETPTSAGWLECRVIGEQDANASAAVGVSGKALGRYSNRKAQTNVSFWDAAINFGGFADFHAAKNHFAELAGVKLSTPKKSNEACVIPFSESQARKWAEKQGFSYEAMVSTGATFLNTFSKEGSRFKNIGWQIYSPEPSGKYTYRHEKPGEKIMGRKENMMPGSPVGFINAGAIEATKFDGLHAVIWVEGTTDMLALETNRLAEGLEGVAVISNNAGTACPRDPVLQAIFRHDPLVILVGDCDKDGQTAVAKRAERVKYYARHAVFKLPYPITDSKGKDIRDWLAEGNSVRDIIDDEFLAIQPIDKGTPSPQAEEEPAEERANTKSVKEVLDKLDLHVLGRDESGDLILWNGAFSRWERIKNLDRWGIKSFLMITGEPGNQEVTMKPSDNDSRMPWELFSKEVACLAAGSVVSIEDRLGMGIWRGQGDDVVIVTKGWAAVWTGDKLVRLTSPIYEGRMLEIGSGEQWIEFEPLHELLRAAESHEWVENVLEDCAAMFSGWRWKGQETSPRLVTGLILATFIQELLEWCPQVVVIGESNSGKSFLLQALSKIFTPLGRKSSHSTDSGLRQAIGCSSRPILIDEWDTTKNRDGILLTMRVACRGDDRYVGTSTQRVVSSSIKQIFWAAGITSGLTEQADMNRFIQLRLLTKRKEDPRLQLRASEYLLELGWQMAAIAIRYGLAGIRRAQTIQDGAYGIDSRIVESMSYPAGILFESLGLSSEDAEEPLRELLTSVDVRDVQSDQEALMDAILARVVDCDGRPRRQSISQLLSKYDENETAADVLEREGIVIHGTRIWFAHIKLRNGLMRGTKYEAQNIDELLMRIDGAKRKSDKRIGSSRASWISLPYDQFRSKYGHGGQRNIEWAGDDPDLET